MDDHMPREHSYNVAGFSFTVRLPDEADVRLLLPAFVPFLATAPDGYSGETEHIFSFDACQDAGYSMSALSELDRIKDDMGETVLLKSGSGYVVRLSPLSGSYVHQMDVSEDFSCARAVISWNDASAASALSSLLRIVYSMAVLVHGAVSVHASCVATDGNAYMFMGRSGTGKSTHSRLWMQNVPGTSLVNDDNPLVRFTDGICMVFGTPWSGKTPCYRNVGFPLCGIVRLVQSSENVFHPKRDAEAFAALLPGCSVIRSDEHMFDAACDTLVRISECVPVGILECRPDAEAVSICRNSLESALWILQDGMEKIHHQPTRNIII